MAGEADGEQDATPTISQVLNGYLQTERARLASRTYARDAEVIGWLKKSLNTDGLKDLTPEEHEQFRSRGFDFERGDPPYCEAVGPYYLMLHLPTFLTAAQLRRLEAPPELPDQAGTVVKKLAKWLETHGYISALAVRAVRDMAAEVGQRTPAMDELAQRLQALTQDVEYFEEEDVPGDFEITHVEPEGLWLHDHIDDSVYGPVPVPDDVHDLCPVGWMIAGTLGRRDGAYQFVDVLKVDP